VILPRRNYNNEKRQRELSRERKKAEKLQRKLDRINARPEDPDPAGAETPDPRPEQ
jgi:hypothetical protein